jgi:membrane associated rhomboid family serine protease
MFPIKDLNPTRRIPIVTYGLVVVNVIVYLWEQALPIADLQEAFMNLSVVPAFVIEDPFSFETLLDLFGSMFFHGGLTFAPIKSRGTCMS